VTTVLSPRTAVFALGANLGDRLAALREGARLLAETLEDVRVSAVYETPPEGGADQPDYLNAVVAGEGDLSPRTALALARSIEAAQGRERPFAGAPRTLDVDVLFLGHVLVDEADLRIPHPRWQVRDFVGVPLMDVLPDMVDPESGVSLATIARRAGWDSSRFPVVEARGSLLSLEVR
jgi:2-amino-4-hydroxy-6-hydroxymethyldihydropteridine diphosphokinase